MVKITQNSWLGGQLDVEMAGRQDVARYKIGATTIRNFVPTRRGGLKKRPGTNYVDEVSDFVGRNADGSLKPFRMIPFRFTEDEGYVMVLTEGKANIYDSAGYYSSVDGVLPYAADELDDVTYVQCGDILYLAHKNHPPAEIDHGLRETKAQYSAWQLKTGSLPAPEGNAAKYIRAGMNDDLKIVYDGDAKAWTLTYTAYQKTYSSKTYYNANGEKGLKKTATYTYRSTCAAGEDALALTFTDFSYSDSGTTTAAVTYGREELQGYVSAEDSYRIFTYKTLVTNMQIAPPTFTDVFLSRQGFGSDYRGGVQELRYAASVVEEIDGTTYESAITEVTKEDGYDKADSEGTSGAQITRTLSYYSPWTESMVVNVTVGVASARRERKITEIRLYKYNGCCYGLIGIDDNKGEGWTITGEATTRTDAVKVTFKDDNITPDASTTPYEEKSVFADASDYPACVSLYQQRLLWSSSKDSPGRIWMSAAGDFHEHRPHTAMQLSDAIDFVVPLVDGTGINFVVELGKLFAFADASEYLIGSDSTSSGVSYETIMTTRQSGVGSSKRLPPIVVNNSLLFCERTGKSVRSFNYDIEQNLYGGDDVSIFSSGIFDEKRIVDWAYQQSPESVLWCVLDDGTMASLTYMKDQNIVAWATHEAGGGGKVRGIAATGALTGTADLPHTTNELMLLVERKAADGTTALTLEQMRPWPKTSDTAANAVCMDCMMTAAVRSADDTIYRPSAYVADAGLYGCVFESEMTTVYPVLGDQVGNAQFDVKNIHHVHLRVKSSAGGTVRAFGQSDGQAIPLGGVLKMREGGSGLYGEGLKDVSVTLHGANGRDGRLTVRQSEPWPFQLLMLEQDFETEEGDNG